MTGMELGESNSKVYLAYDMRDGGGLPVAVKVIQFVTSSKIANFEALLSLRQELLMLTRLSVRAPDIPICYPLGHSKSVTGRSSTSSS